MLFRISFIHKHWTNLDPNVSPGIHKLLLTKLEIENCYVDAHSLILNLNTRIELN